MNDVPSHSPRHYLKGPGLGISNPTGRIADDPGIAGGRMERPIPTRLSREGSVVTWAKRLSRRQSELVSDIRRRDGVALQNLPADGVELSIESNACGALDDDRDRERGNSNAGTIQHDRLFVVPGRVGVDRLCNSHSAIATAAIVHREIDRRRTRQTSASPGHG